MFAQTVERMTCTRLPTDSGVFELYYYRNNNDDKEHLALVLGDVAGQENVLVRVHSECFTGDVLGSLRCDCGEQLHQAMEAIAVKGAGVIVYLRQEGRGIGLLEKLRAYNLQDEGYDTVDANLMLGHQADSREYTVAALILQDLGVQSVRLLTNNPDKIEKLEALGIAVTRRMALRPTVQAENVDYLRTKVDRMRHLLELDADGTIAPELAFMPDKLVKNGRCFITLSYAQSLDGAITAKRGRHTAISGDESMVVTHQLRAAHQAILVGIGTVLADDPRLTVRLADGRHPLGVQPRPVVLDSQLRLPPTARLLQHPHRPWVFTTGAASGEKAALLEAHGAKIIRVASDGNGRVLITAVIDHLYKNSIHNVMVEGGAEIISSFLQTRLVDQMVVTIAPILLGGLNAIGAVDGAELPHLENASYHNYGADILFSGEAVWSKI